MKKLLVGVGLHFSWHGLGIETKLRAPQFALAFLDDSVIDEGLDLNLFGPYSDIARLTMELRDSSSSQIRAGVLYHFNDWLTLGASYEAETTAKLRGSYELDYERAFLNATEQTQDTLVSFIFNAAKIEQGTVTADYLMPYETKNKGIRPQARPPFHKFGRDKSTSQLYFARAALACSTSASKAAASLIAMSLSTLRSSSIPASLRPCMNWPYGRPN